jgi:transmembrane sensor
MNSRFGNQHERFIYLLDGYIHQGLSEEEVEAFFDLLGVSENQALLEKLLSEDLENRRYIGLGTPAQLENARKMLSEKIHAISSVDSRKSRVFWLFATKWHIAAAIAVAVSVTGLITLLRNEQATPAKPLAAKMQGTPGRVLPSLTLADGRVLTLDSASEGALIQQGKTRVEKMKNGQIAYSATDSSEVVYNTLTVPRGSDIVQLQLADGSKVVLNAGSAITYPTAFTGKSRSVSLTGEAYFDIAPNPGKPFTVVKGDTKISVLGTEFDMNAYDDEASVDVTLVRGLVKVGQGTNSSRLNPGQQAQISSTIRIKEDVDIDEVTAWKNGRFQFEGTGIEEVMRQIARWYGLDIVYQGAIRNQHFTGGISRDVNVSQVCKMLETTGAAKFRIEGPKIIVIL